MKKIYQLLTVVALSVAALCSCVPEDVEITLLTDPGTMVYSNERQTASFKISCDHSWKASGNLDWLTVETEKGSSGDYQDVKFSLLENSGYEYREGDITIKSGKSELVVHITQEPQIKYFLNENFDTESLILEGDIPYGWFNIDTDGDGWVWRCLRNTDKNYTCVYSSSYDSYTYRVLTPDNWLVSRAFTLPGTGFNLSWDVMGLDPEFLGDKYAVYAVLGDTMLPIDKLYEGVTDSAEEFKTHTVNLDKYSEINIRIAFRHYDCTDLSSVIITNVKVTNKR
ncbi:MAG: choice-of-anchor J domain-containing protein [Bacteroidales bacterium]|nr:choice-of-anchor J domain-containing protein [Bacteroidales bacterium]